MTDVFDECGCDACIRLLAALAEHSKAVSHVTATRAAVEQAGAVADVAHDLDDLAGHRRRARNLLHRKEAAT